LASAEANMKWLERGGEGAAIGTAVAPGLGTLIGGGIGAIEGLFEGWWMRDKEGKQRRWQDSELLRKYAAIENAGALETSASQDVINRQLGISSQNLASTFATSGGIRTGNYQRKVGELNRNAVEDVARIAQQKALDVEAMKIGYGANVNQFNLELAKLESAKASGDAQMIGASAENLAPAFYDMFFKPKGQGETTVTNPEEIVGGISNSNYNLNEQISGGEYPQYNEDPTLNYIRGLNKPQPSRKSLIPQQDNTDPISILWGG